MRISRVYCEQTMAIGDQIILDTDQSHYVRNVLRLKSGQSIYLFNHSTSADFLATLSIGSKHCFADITSCLEFDHESPLKIHLLVGVSSRDHLDWSIQKTTELGVSKISLFNANHSQSPIKSGQLEKKMKHWQAVAIKACEQSQRHHVPDIQFQPNFARLLHEIDINDLKLITHFEGRNFQDIIKGLDRIRSMALLVGPEGGLSKTEIDLAIQNGFLKLGLGPRVLRTETATTVAVTLAQSIAGDI
ncbi:MAG: 16S rRNA (uracil1498-N3)-methyltransferase [Gammaproteobacteria bacterium]|jgi:16S rRNA (uracil1498-N3)-methyltransferase